MPALERLVRPAQVTTAPLDFFRRHYEIPQNIEISLTSDSLHAAGIIQMLEHGKRYSVSLSDSHAGCVAAEDAIIAHEMAHVYMDVKGLRFSTTEDNERMTDTCVILLGGGLVANFVSYQNSYSGHRKGEILVSTGKVGYFSPEERGYLMAKFLIYSGFERIPEPRAVGMRNSDFEPVSMLWHTADKRAQTAKETPSRSVCPRCQSLMVDDGGNLVCETCGLAGKKPAFLRRWVPEFF